MKSFLFPALLVVAALSPVLVACDSVDNRLDCTSICERYDDCVGNYDVGACKTRCVDSASKDTQFESKVDHCSDCIDGRSCTASAFACTAECVGIVP